MEVLEYTGVFSANARGFGFVTVPETGEEFFIAGADTGGAFDGDTVQIRPLEKRSGKRPEACIVRIAARALTQVVGTFLPRGGYGFVTPDNARLGTDLFIPKEAFGGASEGSRVVARITDYGGDGRSPEGEIVEVLGRWNDPGVDVLAVVRALGLPEAFSEKVLRQAERAAKPVSGADREGRRDLRDVLTVTIDGEDAKDLDDAVSLSEGDGIYHLGVHIADVANYVQENSALDWEAKERGNSVYLADRVIPMLPPSLSNGICSLNAGEDRLALSCLMDIDRRGDILDYEIVESVIRVDRRMSYTQVQRILEGDAAARAECGPAAPMLERMAQLSGLLRGRRQERGAVDFDFPECEIELDQSGEVRSIRPCERNAATRLIEDFMLAANETVAQHFYWLELPFLYRVHEKPEPEKMEKLGLFLHNFGYRIHRDPAGAGIRPKELQKLLNRIAGTPEEPLISRLVLRSMRRACYSTECLGHFGLAAGQYCHFTSPIRRYPDLQIHRIIKDFLRGRLNEGRILHYRCLLPETALHSSQTERRADEAERTVDRIKKARYMEAHLGEVFEGVVSGVTGWGLYVELENTVEGLVHISRLPGDYFIFDESRYELTGEKTGQRYRLGQRLAVRAVGADRIAGTVDLAPADAGETAGDAPQSAETEGAAARMGPARESEGGEPYGEGSAEAGGEQ